jgi:hypothetical protein
MEWNAKGINGHGVVVFWIDALRYIRQHDDHDKQQCNSVTACNEEVQ